MKEKIQKILWHISEKMGIAEMRRLIASSRGILIEDFVRKHLNENPRYADPKKLNRYEYNIYSQSGDDGILNEIFKRVKTTNKYFVEFGVSNGLENNTAALLSAGWGGLWLEGSEKFVSQIEKNFAFPIKEGSLTVRNAFVTAENIQTHFAENHVPAEIDLLSIDIDGNDYWVWKAITKYSPRVVVIEVNPFWGPEMEWAMKYDATHVWKRDYNYGTSMKAVELLGKQKGYSLVGGNLIGNNAFFVRNDLVGDKFAAPFTSENHYEPNRMYLIRKLKYAKAFGENGITQSSAKKSS
jgi:hypothetical protein